LRVGIVDAAALDEIMTALLRSTLTAARGGCCGRRFGTALLALLSPACGGTIDAGWHDSGATSDLGTVAIGADLGAGDRRDQSADAPPSYDMVFTPGDGGLADVTVTVDDSHPGATLSPMFAGFSYEKEQMPEGLFTAQNRNLIGLFKRLGPGLMRIGANDVDRVTWSATAKGGEFGTIAPADIDNLAAFLRAADWKIIYAVSMGNSNAAAAASEANYAVTALGDRLYGLEIGNEPDLYAGKYRASSYAYADFRSEWESFAAAIRAQAPTAPLTGPAAAYNATAYTVPFTAAEASRIALVTEHYYVANGQDASSTVEKLLQPNPGLTSLLAQLSKATTSAQISNGFRLAETNSYYNGGASGVSNAYGTSLWVIDFLFALAAGGASGANFHGGGDGPGYTPIADDSSGNVVGPRPEYYGIALFAQAAAGKLVAAKVSGAAKSLSAYAIAESDGTTAVILVNKDAGQLVVADLDFANTATRATVTELRGPSLNATDGVTLAGVAIAKDGSWAPPLPTVEVSGGKATVGVPPGSAVLVRTR
jgi:hypothetical protein